ncbi:hypothetical protein AMS68_006537 [Peltaster fructicola]|uniref:RNA polymerase II holoenzyme cyclin-like subunit n=1 Tax=Peltaster fructicola TaxID=286661 RepID=A0A6H0Y301_9PEZI|nr:hypothetical protein AMS68_006537 [Peltaster fructicola]
MGAQKLPGDGGGFFIGPHPGVVALPMRFMSQEKIDTLLYSRCTDEQERSLVEAKEDSLRLKGIAWIDQVRRAMQMPIHTYTTACTYYHKLRLVHRDAYFYSDAAAASLLVACKAEETKKYSRDILAAVHNLKASGPHEQIMADDPMFEGHSRAIIELERLVLETIKFNFRDRNPHDLLIKLARKLGPDQALCRKAFTILTELYRTFAPLKHTAITLCYASLELAAHLLSDEEAAEKVKNFKLVEGTPSRAEVMEVLLDALDHYARHTTLSVLGPRYPLDKFVQIRLAYNRECETNAIPRYVKLIAMSETQVQNGHPTPVSPADHPAPQDLNELLMGDAKFNKVVDKTGTLRFAMNPDDALAETDAITKYLKDEYEEIEEEVEIQEPPRQPAARRGHSQERRGNERRNFSHRGGDRGRGRGQSDRGRHGDHRRRDYDDRYERRFDSGKRGGGGNQRYNDGPRR